MIYFSIFWMNSLWTDGYLCPSQILKFNVTPMMWDIGSIPRLGRSPREGNGNPPQYSCLENPMGRGAWWVHGVAELDMTEQLSTQALCV